MNKQIAVVGSFNMDLVCRTARLPRKGETVTGTEFGMFVGGKGCNQAIAAARLGSHVTMIGRVGLDAFGDVLLQTLAREGIDSSRVVRDVEAGTGIASIVVDDQGDNTIIVAPRANMRLNGHDVDAARHSISQARVLLLQLEVALDACVRAAMLAHESGALILLNPAPAQQLPDSLLQMVDIITPNETEATLLTGVTPGDHPDRSAQVLRSRGVRTVVITLGRRGAFISSPDEETLVPSFLVQPIDTTAAGDAFCGALAVALAEERPLVEAVRFGNAAGALACTRMGAEPSLPRRADVDHMVG